MKKDPISRQIGLARAAIMSARADDALRETDKLLAMLRRDPPDADRIAELERELGGLRSLAEAALDGTRAAAEQMQAILQEARSLETYDRRGKIKVTDTAAEQPRRY